MTDANTLLGRWDRLATFGHGLELRLERAGRAVDAEDLGWFIEQLADVFGGMLAEITRLENENRPGVGVNPIPPAPGGKLPESEAP